MFEQAEVTRAIRECAGRTIGMRTNVTDGSIVFGHYRAEVIHLTDAQLEAMEGDGGGGRKGGNIEATRLRGVEEADLLGAISALIAYAGTVWTRSPNEAGLRGLETLCRRLKKAIGFYQRELQDIHANLLSAVNGVLRDAGAAAASVAPPSGGLLALANVAIHQEPDAAKMAALQASIDKMTDIARSVTANTPPAEAARVSASQAKMVTNIQRNIDRAQAIVAELEPVLIELAGQGPITWIPLGVGSGGAGNGGAGGASLRENLIEALKSVLEGTAEDPPTTPIGFLAQALISNPAAMQTSLAGDGPVIEGVEALTRLPHMPVLPRANAVLRNKALRLALLMSTNAYLPMSANGARAPLNAILGLVNGRADITAAQIQAISALLPCVQMPRRPDGTLLNYTVRGAYARHVTDEDNIQYALNRATHILFLPWAGWVNMADVLPEFYLAMAVPMYKQYGTNAEGAQPASDIPSPGWVYTANADEIQGRMRALVARADDMGEATLANEVATVFAGGVTRSSHWVPAEADEAVSQFLRQMTEYHRKNASSCLAGISADSVTRRGLVRLVTIMGSILHHRYAIMDTGIMSEDAAKELEESLKDANQVNSEHVLSALEAYAYARERAGGVNPGNTGVAEHTNTVEYLPDPSSEDYQTAVRAVWVPSLDLPLSILIHAFKQGMVTQAELLRRFKEEFEKCSAADDSQEAYNACVRLAEHMDALSESDMLEIIVHLNPRFSARPLLRRSLMELPETVSLAWLDRIGHSAALVREAVAGTAGAAVPMGASCTRLRVILRNLLTGDEVDMGSLLVTMAELCNPETGVYAGDDELSEQVLSALGGMDSRAARVAANGLAGNTGHFVARVIDTVTRMQERPQLESTFVLQFNKMWTHPLVSTLIKERGIVLGRNDAAAHNDVANVLVELVCRKQNGGGGGGGGGRHARRARGTYGAVRPNTVNLTPEAVASLDIADVLEWLKSRHRIRLGSGPHSLEDITEALRVQHLRWGVLNADGEREMTPELRARFEHTCMVTWGLILCIHAAKASVAPVPARTGLGVHHNKIYVPSVIPIMYDDKVTRAFSELRR